MRITVSAVDGGRRSAVAVAVAVLLVVVGSVAGADTVAAAPALGPGSARVTRQAAGVLQVPLATVPSDELPPELAPDSPEVPSAAEVRAEVAPGEEVSVGVASVDAAGNFSVTARAATGPQEVLAVVAAAADQAGTVAVGLPQEVRVLGAATPAVAATPAAATPAAPAIPATTRAAPATRPAAADTSSVDPAAGSDPMRPDSYTRPWPWNQYAMDMLCADPTADAQNRYRCDGYAWQHATGKGQIVALLDQGVDTTHPDLTAGLTPGARCILVRTTPCLPVAQTAPADRSEHGTHVAGLVASTTGNGIGTSGLARDAKVMPIEVIDNSDSGTSTDVAAGVTWAVDNGATVINMSIGTAGDNTNDPVLAAAVANALRLGVPVVAAAGNEGENGNLISYPAAYPGVIAVANVDSTRTLVKTSTRASWVDVAAPGDLVVSTLNGGWYGYLSGTSMATPYVSAAVALLRQLHPDFSPAQLGALITASAEDAGPPGWDAGYGWGVLRPLAALQLPIPTAALPPGAAFHPIDPARVADTRTGTAIGVRTARAVSVATDTAGHPVVPAGAVAVAYNLTVPAPAASGHLRVMPGDVGSSSTSAINFVAGQTIANGLVVKVDAARTIRVFNAADRPTHAVVDIVGYFLPEGVATSGDATGPLSSGDTAGGDAASGDATPGTGFTAIQPVRVFDADAAPEGRLAPGDTRNVSVATGLEGQPDVVPQGTAAIAYNITVVGPAGCGHLRVMPGDVPVSGASTINWTLPGDTVANGSVVRVAADRTINVHNAAGVPVRFLVDVVGYYQVGSGALFHPVAPARLYDSRQVLPMPGVLASGAERTLFVGDGRDLAGTVTVPDVVPAGATALAYNVTVPVPVGSGGGHLRVWPAGGSRPNASVINWAPSGRTRANGLVVGVSADRAVQVYNGAGDSVDVVVDALGYYQ